MISRYNYKDLLWVDAETPSHEEIRQLMAEFDIHPIVADELLSPSVRSKVDHYENFIYCILHFPAIRHSHSGGNIQEVDFVIGRKFLLTVHYDAIDPMHKFSKVFEVNSILDHSNIGDHAGFLFFYMLRKIYASVHHELSAIGDLLQSAEERVFKGEERKMVEELSLINRDLIAIHRALYWHERVLDSLRVASKEFFGAEFGHYIDNILGEYHKVNRGVEEERDILEDLRTTNNSLLSAKTNEVMRSLTAISVVAFPASFLAWVFSIDARNMPIVGDANDFWILLGFMGVSSLLTFLILRAKKWL